MGPSRARSQPKTDELIQAKLKALILDVIHYLAVLDALMEANTTRPNEWAWFKQLRYCQPSQSTRSERDCIWEKKHVRYTIS